MLYTNLIHIESAHEHSEIVNEHENVVVICGRMGTQSIPVFRIAEELEAEFPNVRFYDMEFDNPESHVIINLPEVQRLIGIPVVVYYKNGSVVKATAGIQTKVEISGIIENQLLVNENVHIDQLTQ